MSALLLAKARTAIALGLGNVARVACYRLLLRARVHPVQRVKEAASPQAPFFDHAIAASVAAVPQMPSEVNSYFGWIGSSTTTPPDWFLNVLSGARAGGAENSWWRLPDFDASVGDVKGIWEPSRFNWVITLAQHAVSGDVHALDQLNGWLDDWCAKNPAYHGYNWKCAQEASIRIMRLAVAALVLRQMSSPKPALLDLLEIHLERIVPTIGYAIGQENNHATSEAAALFIGGSWLARQGRQAGYKLHELGLELLSKHAERLIEPDGTFSQYSVNYHRLMLDTFSLTEIWRRRLELPRFQSATYVRIVAATEWLRAMVDPVSGDAPNLGANDGANLLPLTDAGYRDYRPSVQLATILFSERIAYPGVRVCREHAQWLGVDDPEAAESAPVSHVFSNGGVAVLRRGTGMALLRFPGFRFRPSHADVQHVDLWVGGENLLRDGGSYSYAAELQWLEYFSGASGHNSVQFDERQQMPRIGRFLWANWLRTSSLVAVQEQTESTGTEATYTDAEGATHTRRVELFDSELRVTDVVSGFSHRAVFRWRLMPGEWRVVGSEAIGARGRITVDSNIVLGRVTLVEGWESRFYGLRTTLPVLEIEIASAATVVTTYSWKK